MQITAFLSTLLAATAIASPTYNGGGGGGGSPYVACSPGLYSTAQCCATDVLGVADLDCASPSKVPTSAGDFQKTCAAGGQRARCCVLPVAGQALLCQTPAGVTY